MAGIFFTAQPAEIATGTALKTLLQVVAATNTRAKIHEWSVSFDGISNTDAPILVQLIRQTTAGTMTALTLDKIDSDAAEALQTTAQHTATAEPTLGAEIMGESVHPQGGYTWQAAFGREIIINGGNRVAIVVTSAVAVNAKVRMLLEE